MLNHDHTTTFTLVPHELNIFNANILSDHSKQILEKHSISLELDIFESINDCSQPTLLFVHANSFSKAAFENLVEYYQKDYHIITVDLLGHGSSSKISDFDCLNHAEKEVLASDLYHPLGLAAGLIQLLEKKNIQNVHALGWSLGGHLIYSISESNPELIASITTIGSPPVKMDKLGLSIAFKEWFVKTLVPEWVNRPKKLTPEEAEAMLRKVGYEKINHKTLGSMVGSDILMRKYLFNHLFSGSQQNKDCPDTLAFIHNTSVPLNLLVGDNDAGIESNFYKTHIKSLKNSASRVTIIPNASHALLENHVFFQKFYNEFLHDAKGCHQTANAISLQN